MTNLTARHVTPRSAAPAPPVRERAHPRDEQGDSGSGATFVATLLAMLPTTPVPGASSPAKDSTSSSAPSAVTANAGVAAGSSTVDGGPTPAAANPEVAPTSVGTEADASSPVRLPVAPVGEGEVPSLATTAAGTAATTITTTGTAATTVTATTNVKASYAATSAAVDTTASAAAVSTAVPDAAVAAVPAATTGNAANQVDAVAAPDADGGADIAALGHPQVLPAAPLQVAAPPAVMDEVATGRVPTASAPPTAVGVLSADGTRDNAPVPGADGAGASVAPLLAAPLPVLLEAAAPAPPVAAAIPAAHLQILTAVSPLLQAPDGSYSLELLLRPHELGLVQVTVEMRGGELTIHLHAADAGAGDVLRDSLPDLRQQLEAQGMRTGGLDVGTGSSPDRRSAPAPRELGAAAPAIATQNPVGAAAPDLDRSPHLPGGVDVRL